MYTLEALLAPDHPNVLFSCISGSRAYGTATAQSDEDWRGIFALPAAAYLNLSAPPAQIADERGDRVFFTVKRTIELLAQANPNMLEVLFMPADCVRKRTHGFSMLEEKRAIFVTQQCVDTHLNYALSQIKKARGQNKWINQPRPLAPPRKEQFCFVILSEHQSANPPARPRAMTLDLTRFQVAKVEHARDLFRLYDFGEQSSGVFRDEQLVLSPIALTDEARFSGFLIFNEAGFKQAQNEHHNYWTWKRERNDARWLKQESGELDYDAKNLMHTVRLLLSARSILETGLPLVRFEGESLALLMAVREGRFSYREVIALSEGIAADCEALKKRRELPFQCDMAHASQLLAEITRWWEEQ